MTLKWLTPARLFLFVLCIVLAVVTVFIKSSIEKKLSPEKNSINPKQEIDSKGNSVKGASLQDSNSTVPQSDSIYTPGKVGQGFEIPVRNQIQTSYFDPIYKPGDGLEGYYHNNRTFNDLRLKKTDKIINLKVPAGSTPNKLITSTEYSVRWEGQIYAPTTSDYNFYLSGDNAVIKLWIENTQLSFAQLRGQDVVIPVHLEEKQRYDIKIEMYAPRTDFESTFQLMWDYQGQTKIAVPTSNLFTQKLPAMFDLSIRNEDFTEGKAQYGLKVARSGFYYPWVKVYTGSKDRDTFEMQIDDKYYVFELPSTASQWLWLKPSLIESTTQNKVATAYIARGNRVLSISKLEPNIKIERMILVDSVEYAPDKQ